ncbi:MAG: cytochrome c oxidase subunit II [Acidimicrobiales bacterium]
MTDAGWVLDPRTPGAEKVALLTWLMLAVAAIAFVMVLGLLALGLARRRRLPLGAERWVVGGGLVFPAVVILALSGLTVWALDADTPPAGADPALTVNVIGHQYWWEIRYQPGGGSTVSGEVVTANELVLPVDQPVQLELTSDDVVHSFWVPELGPKRDLVPGRTNHLRFTIDQAGDLRGQCAEFCGAQHARMAFLVHAVPADEFETWLANEAAPAPVPTTDSQRAGMATFQQEACSSCHAIRGVVDDPAGLLGADRNRVVIGPDLTHLAARDTLAAVTVPNDRGHLGGWIADPQSTKPGSLMPAVPLDPEQLLSLLDYLQSLR